MPTLHVEVTGEDISAGQQGDCMACPVALAVRRAAGRRASVADGGVRLYRPSRPRAWDNFTLPAGVRRRILRYDTFGKMRPFSFFIEVPFGVSKV